MNNDRWNLISSNTKNDLTRRYTTLKRNEMVPIEEEEISLYGSKQDRMSENVYDRRKRKYNEFEQTNYLNNPNKNPLQNLNTSYATNRHYGLTLDENLNKMQNEDQITKKVKIDQISIKQDPDIGRLLNVENLEKYLYLDERFIDTDRNISYGGINLSKK
jgi:hypothetical protein